MFRLPNEIIARSRYLHERLGSLPISAPEAIEPNDNFRFWKQQFSSGSYDQFPARLRSLGLSEEQATLLAQDADIGSPQIEPDWQQILARALESPANPLDGANEFPFVRLWLPLATFGRNSLNRVAADSELILPVALNGLLVALIKDISEFAALPTYEVFSEFQKAGRSFDDFIRGVQNSGYLLLFERFPVLARQLSRLLTTWIEATNLFLDRLATDFREIQIVAAGNGAHPKLSATRVGISDRHDGGRQVILLDFDDGSKALYKPKNGSSSEALLAIDSWLAAHGFSPGWRIPRVVVRPDYVWEEYVEQRSCESTEEVRRYYRSGGELLCLAYVLNAVDLWDENLVAGGDRPTVIDTECFFQPGRESSERNPQDAHAFSLGRPSVIETGLLPCWQITASHKSADYSGLGRGVVDLPDRKVTEWDLINSNDMRPVTKSAPARHTANGVRLQGVMQDVRNCQTELTEGFCSLYRFILSRKAEFSRFIEQFSQTETRVLYRPTQLYVLLLKQARFGINLTSGFRQSAVFEQLYRVPLRDDALTAKTKRLIDFETACLLGLDIPRFRVRLDSKDLRSLNFWAPDSVIAKPIDTVKQRIAATAEDDLRFQVEVIIESLKRFPVRIERPVKAKDAESVVRQFAVEICDRINPPDHLHLWEPSSYLPVEMNLAQRQGMYLGDFGTLVFLAAADDILDYQLFPQPRALRLIDQLNQFDFPSDYPLGICQGVGALIYGSLLLAKLTKRADWSQLAVNLNGRIQGVSEANGFDLTSGLAGFLLAATRLFEITRDPTALANAQAAAQVLAKHFNPNSGWRHPDGTAYLGLAHGIAGIVLALDRYRRATADRQHDPLIEKALELESKQFDRKAFSWPVTLQGPRTMMNNWCNGAAGILLSRAATKTLKSNGISEEEVAGSLNKISRRGMMDHWCCGNFGIAETLGYIAQESSLLEAQTQATNLVEESLQRGLGGAFFRFQPSVGENLCFSASLFRGISGIGYSLLRFLNPGKLPCILAFEV